MGCRVVHRLAMAAALLGVPAMASSQLKTEHARAVTSTVSIRISGSFGVLRIIGWDRDSLTISGVIPSGARFEGNFDDKGPPAPGVKMYLEASEASSATARLEIHVPARARLWAKGSTSNIEVSGVTGGLDLNIVAGSVQVTGSPRELNVESMDGAISVIGSPEWIRLKSATGDITLSGGSSDAGLSTISGTLRAAGGTIERAKLESVTGPIIFAENPLPGASLDFNSHSGRIELYLPKLAAEIDAASMTGTIENSYTNRPAIVSRDKRGQEIGIGIGYGGPRYYVRTFKGTIVLRSIFEVKK